MPIIVLASGSPRRQELLRLLLPEFRILTSLVEDHGSDSYPEVPLEPLDFPSGQHLPANDDPRMWAWRKAIDVAVRHEDVLPGDSLVLGADTVVVGPGGALGKPRDEDHAFKMLSTLRGRTHYVVTGYCLLKRAGQAWQTTAFDAMVTAVAMVLSTDDELKGYVATGEPSDKAGAYALQGGGSALVSSVDGCHNNVIGLPLCAIRAELAANGVEMLPYPPGGYRNSCAPWSVI